MIRRLLIITQKVDKDDDVLGFFHRWLEEFAKYVEKVEVVCLFEGMHALPANVSVWSLGKEKGYSKIRRLLRFWKLCWKLTPRIDGVFVHMNPVYVVMGFPFFKMLAKPIVLWFTHRDITALLRIAEKLVTKILSVSPEGFRLASPKVSFVGHGIDTDFFAPSGDNGPHEGFRIIAVGRLTPIKNFDTLILAVDRARDSIQGLGLTIVGEAMYPSDAAYAENLKEMVRKRGLEKRIEFTGHVSYSAMPARYCRSDLAANLAPRGGMDKTVLEAMACGLTVLVSNETFREDLGEYAPRLMFHERNVIDLAKKLADLASSPDRQVIGTRLRARVVERHNIGKLIPEILGTF